MQRYEVHLFADAGEFRLLDDHAGFGDPTAWSEAGSLLAMAPHAIAVFTSWDVEIAITVELCQERPAYPPDRWLETAAGSLQVDSPRVVVTTPTDSFADAFRISVRPGTYEALVCRGEEDRYLVSLWRV